MGKISTGKTQNIHPLLRREYALFTPPINEFFETVCDWIDDCVTGAYIFGTPRLGKSRAVRYWIGELLAENYKGVLPFFTLNYRSHDRVSESDFLIELLAATQHKIPTSGTRFDRQERLVNYFCTRADRAGGNHIVLMIDEAQNMRDLEYRWLCNIQNQLDELGYRFTVISVGSHELTYQHEVFALGEDVHLMGRFMIRSARFHGIRSNEELAAVLDGYDSHTEWPPGSDVSYTAHFAPRAFEAGFRLADYAEELLNRPGFRGGNLV